ncbi:MAG: SNF2-related protein, partial [Bacteroidales bacterium]|nr:SNF2-related protein [Bacteroidales bacterium]
MTSTVYTGRERLREKLFALILTQHRRWGTLLVPYILERKQGLTYSSLAEALSPFPDSTTLSELDNDEREVVELLNEYSDRNLFKIFSKHRNVKEFMETVEEKDFETLIKPYIESRIYQSLHIALKEDIPVYNQKTRIGSLHPEDRLVIIPEGASPLFRFDRDATGSRYSLIIESDGKPLDLRSQPVDILSNKPCVIRAGNRLHFVSDIEGAKLKPFLTRSHITIPQVTEEKYFRTFVLSVVNTHNVTGTGFRIERSEPVMTATLTVENGLRGIPVAILKFRYDDREIYYPDDLRHFTTFSNEEGVFTFRRKERDAAREKNYIGLLEDSGLFSEDGIHFMTAGAEAEKENTIYVLIETVSVNRKKLTDAGLIIRTGSLDVPYSLDPVEITLSHQIINDWFDLKAVVQIGSFRIPFTRLRKYILEGNREYPLPDGTVAVLPEEWFTRYRGLFEMGKDEDDSLMVHKQHFGIISELLTGENCDICTRLSKLAMPDQLPVINAPSGLKAEMRPYQIEGLSWMHFLQTQNLGGCLADDMGLGKTLQTLALLMWNKENIHLTGDRKEEGQMSLFGEENTGLTSLIVVPASLSHNWYNEIKKFCPALKTKIHQGTGRQRSASQFSGYDIIISSYHTVRQDIEFFITMNFFYVVLDESQYIKNPSSNIYRAVTRLKSEHRLVLTGTPVENSLTDLWTQLSF